MEEKIDMYNGFYYPVLRNARKEVINKVKNASEEIYSKHIPPQVTERLKWELDAIEKSGSWTIFNVYEKLVARSKEFEYETTVKGSIAASLVAFFLGITEINPLKPHYVCPVCKYNEFDLSEKYDCEMDMPEKLCSLCMHKMNRQGFSLNPKTLFGVYGDKWPDIHISFSDQYRDNAVEHLQEILKKDYVFDAETYEDIFHDGAFFIIPKDVDISEISYSELTNHFLCFRLGKEDGLIKTDNYIPEYDLNLILSIIQNGKDGIGELENEQLREIISECDISLFSDLIKAVSLSHSTGGWENNARVLISDGTATIREVLSSKDDVVGLLEDSGMDEKNIAKYFGLIRFGKLKRGIGKEDWRQDASAHGIEEWQIASAEKIDYLFPKSHIVGRLINDIKITMSKLN